jgi:sulfite reductase (ferredoxin)
MLTKDIKPATHIQTINDFQKHFVDTGAITFGGSDFKEFVLRINKNEPTKEFALQYRADARKFLEDIFAIKGVEKEAVVVEK